MPKILKAHHFTGEHARSISPKILEDFPEHIVQGNGHDVIEEEFIEVVDPEAVRAGALAAAQTEIEQTTQKAFEEGIARGEKEGRDAFNASISQCTENALLFLCDTGAFAAARIFLAARRGEFPCTGIFQMLAHPKQGIVLLEFSLQHITLSW